MISYNLEALSHPEQQVYSQDYANSLSNEVTFFIANLIARSNTKPPYRNIYKVY